MNHGQEPVTGTSDSHKRLSRLAVVALVVALVGTVLGSAVMFELWWRIDEATTTTTQAAASSRTDTGAQTTR
jgi:hypothetical protein